jgi:hypothetical protein
VCHLTAGRDRERRVRGKPEDLPEPVADDDLHDRRRRAERAQPRALVPDRREPVGADGRGQRSADDIPEIARPCRRDDAALDLSRHQLDHLARIRRRARKRPSQRVRDLVDGVPREDRALVERVEEVRRQVGGEAEQLALVTHGSRV